MGVVPMRLVVLTLFVFMLLVSIGVLALAGNALSTSNRQTTVVPTSVPRPAAQRPAPAVPPGTVEFRSISEIEKNSAGLKSGQPFRLAVTQDELTSRVRQYLANDPQAPFRDVSVRLSPGSLVFTGKVTAMGLTLDATAIGEPVIENGQARLVVRDVAFGEMAVPGPAKGLVNDAINRAIESQSFEVPATVTSVDVVDGQLMIVGRTR